MAVRSRSLLLVVFALVAVGAGFAFWLASRDDGTKVDIVQGVPPPTIAQTKKPELEGHKLEPPDRVGHTDSSASTKSAGVTTTTVAFPVQLSLDLIVDGSIPTVEGVPPLGSGRNAHLSGIAVRGNDKYVDATIKFLAGMNTGRELRANSEGAWGATDLYPGLSIVRVDGPGVAGSTREVLLRANKDSLLNISYDFTANIGGTVYQQPEGTPLADVDVELDGQHTTTNEAGEFNFSQMTAGDKLLLVLRKKGYASYRELIGVAHGQTVPRDRYKFNLRKASLLHIVVPELPGDAQQATLVLMNAMAFGAHGELAGQRTYPWHQLDPLKVGRGRSIEVDDLAEGSIDVYAFALGAAATPPVSRVTVHEGMTTELVLHFDAASVLTGKVVDAEGKSVEGAEVKLEAPDQTVAMLNSVGQASAFLECEVLPSFPCSLQTAVTGFDGRFTFSAYERAAPSRYLSAKGPGDKGFAIRIVKSTDGEIELKLAPKSATLAKFSIEFPGRTQGLPVDCTINGVPQLEQIIGSNAPLLIENLPEGIWRLSAKWNGDPLFATPPQLQIRGAMSYPITLPKGAIEGQDEDTLQRAGRK